MNATQTAIVAAHRSNTCTSVTATSCDCSTRYKAAGEVQTPVRQFATPEWAVRGLRTFV